jgi:ECF transporter S component (folate family)
MRNNVKKLVFAALLVALSVIITKFFNFPIPTLYGGTIMPYFGYLVVMFSGFLLGPSYGAAVGGVSDILGYFISPLGGAFFPGFTLTSILVGLVPGLLYKYAKRNNAILIFTIFITAVIEMVSTTLWVSILYNIDFKLILIPRLITGTVLWAIQGVFVVSLLKVSKRTGIAL